MKVGVHHRLAGRAPVVHPKVVPAWLELTVQNALAARDKRIQLLRLRLVEIEKALEVSQRDDQQMARRQRI